MKKTFYTEAAYLLGLFILALGTAFMERADFGMSMVVAPAYIFHLKISQFLPFFSFGMAEYCLQALLVILLIIVMRRFKKGYLFSFLTAVLYGFILDGCIALVALMPGEGYIFRTVFFTLGLLFGSVGVAMLFHTYLAPEAYELIVKEISEKSGGKIAKVKTIYDLTSLSVSVILSFCFFGFLHFEGVKLGTLITALVNGWLIGRLSGLYERVFEFKDALPLRKYFEQ